MEERVFIGQKVRDFSLNSYYQKDFKEIHLSDYKGKWVILIFYPADFTFVCPTELEETALHYNTFKNLSAEVLSISTDTQFAHKAWHDSSKSISKIEYPMLSDPTGEISRYFGVYLEKEGLALRGTFIIDPDGILRVLEINDNSIGRSTRELMRKLQACIFVRDNGGKKVCPSSWEVGSDSLEPGLDLVGKI